MNFLFANSGVKGVKFTLTRQQARTFVDVDDDGEVSWIPNRQRKEKERHPNMLIGLLQVIFNLSIPPVTVEKDKDSKGELTIRIRHTTCDSDIGRLFIKYKLNAGKYKKN